MALFSFTVVQEQKQDSTFTHNILSDVISYTKLLKIVIL